MKVSKDTQSSVGPHPASKELVHETQWWIAFLKGDDVALARIYRTYAPKLFNYGRQFTPDNALV